MSWSEPTEAEFVAAETVDDRAALVYRNWAASPGDPGPDDRAIARLILARDRARDRARPLGLEDLTREVFLRLVATNPGIAGARVVGYQLAQDAAELARGLQDRLDEIAGRVA